MAASGCGLSAPSLPGAQVGINSNSQLTGAANDMLTDNITGHVPIGFGFKHDTNCPGLLTAVTNPGGTGTDVEFQSKLAPTL